MPNMIKVHGKSKSLDIGSGRRMGYQVEQQYIGEIGRCITMYAWDNSMDEYIALVRHFPLVSIADDTHLDAAIQELNRLLDKSERTDVEDVYMTTLGELIEAYETAHIIMPKVSGVEMVRFLMEQHNLKQNDMNFAFGNEANTSATLKGNRPIGLAPARRLSARFNVPIDVFLTANE